METRSRKRKDSDVESVGSVSSEPAITRSRSNTPFTLRSQCKRHGSECPEGHGIAFKNRFSPSPKSKNRTSKRTFAERSGIFSRKNLSSNLNAQNNKYSNPTMTTQNDTKPTWHTSDYSSGEEERIIAKNNHSTPQHSSSLTISPIQRSAEKTDYTYAKSYSYRTEVTPERVICMPNMTRRSIERCHGEGFSSPELRYGSTQMYFNSLKRAQGLSNNSSMQNSEDLDQQSDRDETYYLKTPSNTFDPVAKTCSRTILSKLGHMIFNLAWWIYLITCYSLLLDTYVLQSRGITKLRNFCLRQTKAKPKLLMTLFLFLLFLMCAGGLLYFALYSLGYHKTEKTVEPSSNPSISHNISPNIPLPAYTQSTSHKIQDQVWDEMRKELNHMKAIMNDMQQKINKHDGSVLNLVSQIDSCQGEMHNAKRKMEDCCDSIDYLVEAKLRAFASVLSQQTGMNFNDVEDFVKVFNGTLNELKEFKDWARVSVDKNAKLVEELEQMRKRLAEEHSLLLTKNSADLDEAIKKWETDSKFSLINNLKEQLLADIRHEIKNLNVTSTVGVSKEQVEELIHSALGVYDSDKTGLADYALEPAGGVILSTRCTETFSSHRPRLSIWGFSLWNEPNNPRVVIQPGIVPGQCWSFRGFDGYLVIQLSRKIVPTAFTLEHIPKSLAPDGQIDSAPRNFTVFGLTKEIDSTGTLLGHYTFDSAGEPLQTFQVQADGPGAFSIVELRIHSNHGNLNYTCLYRFRVHGKVVPPQ